MKPTPKQLAYLKSLAENTGTTFRYPKSSAQASAQIRRMKARPRSSAGERTRERRDVQRELAERSQDSAAVRVGRDVRGYGSSARWAHTPDDAPRSLVAALQERHDGELRRVVARRATSDTSIVAGASREARKSSHLFRASGLTAGHASFNG